MAKPLFCTRKTTGAFQTAAKFSFVEVALAGAAVADHGEGDDVVPLEAGRVGQTHRVRQLGGERGAERGDAVLTRVVAGVPVPAQQGQRLDRVEPARHGGQGVPVAGEQPVPLLKHQGGGDLARLLAGARRVDRQTALLGQRGGLRVVPPAADQLGVEPEQQLGVDVGDRVRTEHPVGLGSGAAGRGR
ncbi:hypothetical protein SMICM304S_06672 [Streptomyces microflavus]